jgi:hypothetical protein
MWSRVAQGLQEPTFDRFRLFAGKRTTAAPSGCSLLPRGRRERHGDRGAPEEKAHDDGSARNRRCFVSSSRPSCNQDRPPSAALLAQLQTGEFNGSHEPRQASRLTKLTALDRWQPQNQGDGMGPQPCADGAIVKSPRLEAPEIDCALLWHECASMGTSCLQRLDMSALCCMLCGRPLPVVTSITILLAKQKFGARDRSRPVFNDASTSAVVLCWPSSEF